MQFSGFTKKEEAGKIIFYNSSIIKNIKKINYYKDDASGSFIKKEFRWSPNGSYWSSWEKLEQSSLSSIKIQNSSIFLEIRYVGTGSVDKFSIYYTSIGSSTPKNINSTPDVSKIIPAAPKNKQKVENTKMDSIGSVSLTRTQEKNIIYFRINGYILDANSIKYFRENSSGSFTKKEFRWSFSKTYWSSWEPLTQENISSIKMEGRYLFLEIRYISSGGIANEFKIFYEGGKYIPNKSTSVNSKPSNNNKIYTPDVSHDICNIGKVKTIDADTLNGLSGESYLWRPNHKGQQPISSVTGLEKIIAELHSAIIESNAGNVDGPGTGVFFGKDLNTLLFKRINPGEDAYITETPEGIITIGVDPSIHSSIIDLYSKYELSVTDASNLGGGAEIFKNKSNQRLDFRTLVPGDSRVLIETLGDQIRIGFDASLSGGPIWTDPIPVSANIGGISSGEVLLKSPNLNSIQILEKMLYEYKPPEVKIWTDPCTGYYEKYDPSTISMEPSIYFSFNNNPFQKTKINEANIQINGYSVPGMDPISYSNANSGNGEWKDITIFVGQSENVNYKVKIMHDVESNPMPPVEVSIGYKFVLPYIWGVVNNEITIDNITPSIIEGFHSIGQKIISEEKSREIIYNRPSGMIKMKFLYAYDASYNELKSIFDIKNDFNVINSFDTKILNLSLNGQSGIPYRIYLKNHWINVDSFKLAFNI
jgi:hypothetical protein